MGRTLTTRLQDRWRWLPVVAIAVLILLASVVRPPVGGRDLLGPPGFVGVDKWFHAAGYAGLAATLVYALAEDERPTSVVVALVLFLSLSYGLAVELLQATLSTRRFESADLLANAVGALAVVLVWRVTVRFRRALPASTAR